MALRIMIDKEFKSLIQPLRVEEYKNLEESLINEGCRDPIILWNDVIVDGHNRYEICTRLNIPFNTRHKGFSSRAEAISWICLNQLSRRNITEEAFRYLIGKRYDAEKQMAQYRNAVGKNQYSAQSEGAASSHIDDSSVTPNERRTSAQLGRLYNLNRSTVESYGKLSRSLDELERKAPGILPVILSGTCKISKENINTLAKMPTQDVHAIAEHLQSKVASKKPLSRKASDRAIQEISASERKEAPPALVTGVKNMPTYDPDAIINEVLLTVPSWKKELDKLIEKGDLIGSSFDARRKLFKVLCDLQSSISKLQIKLKR